MTQLTVELLKTTLPKALQGNATQELADHINNINLDPEVAEEVRNNFLSYTRVLQEGKFKTESYLDAVTYVTHKLMGYSNQDAYIRTFPQRYQTLVAKGISAKDLSAYVAAYHSNKLVNLILEQSIVPSWLLNRDVYQRAINTQFELMTDPNVSAKVRSDAANSILTHLKQPEAQKVELEVGVKHGGGIADLMATMNQLARQQQELIQRGVPARQVARERLVVEGEVVDADFRDVSTAKVVEVDLAQPGVDQSAVVSPSSGGQMTTRPEVLAEPQPGNPGVPPHPSLFQPSSPSPAVSSETAAAPAPGATPASAASPAARAEGEGGGVGEGATAQASGNEAVTHQSSSPFRSHVSLFDPGTFPIGAELEAGA